MSTFYTNCVCRGDTLLYRGVESSKRICKRIPYTPTLFIPSKEESKIKTLDGINVGSMKFDSIREANSFVDRYKDVDNFQIFGNTGYNYVYLSDQFPDEIDFDISQMVIAILDIEVCSSDGFPDPKEAKQPVVSIALKIKQHDKEFTYVFGCKDFVNDRQDLKYVKCLDEQTLLESFIKTWSKFYPDITTGWNSETFDWLYLINRIDFYYRKTIDYKKFSPFGNVYIRESKNFDGSIRKIPEIVGVSILDYMDLYKKFVYTARESYRLDYICHVELGERKLNYDEYSNLTEFYEKDYQRFIAYNIKDIDLVDLLDKKLNLLQQSIQIAFDSKVNFTDVFMQVRMWDSIIFDYFRKNNLAFPFKKQHIKTAYAGAYVKEPITGFHKWVVSMDVASMYPNLIVQYNISPDTITGKFNQVDVQSLLEQEYDFEYLKDSDLALAANGQHFKRDKQGFLPEIIEKMYADRVRYKKLMLEKKKELELIESEINRRGLNI